MRQLLLLAAFILLVTGCGKKPPEPAVTVEISEAPAVDTTASDRAKLLNDLKSTNQKARKDAVEELADWVDSDPQSVAALLELLGDKTTSGAGRILPTQISSTREAAARTLLAGGSKGEAALKDKGLAILRAGLADPQPAIREHTAYTIGLLGPLGRPLSADVMKLCTAPEPNVRGVAFDTLKVIGVADVPAFVALLNHDNRDIGRLAAEQVYLLAEVPPEAVPALMSALASDEATVRIGAAAGLATVGPKAAQAAPVLASAIKKSYPEQPNPMGGFQPGPEMVYWRALARIGPDAVGATAGLLSHSNWIVRRLAVQTLEEIGSPAKSAADKLKDALKDPFVGIDAACALCRIGENQDSAIAFINQAIDAPFDPAKSLGAAAQAAIEALPRMGESGKKLTPIALAKLSSDNPFARFGAIGLVGTLPPEEAARYVADVGKCATDAIPDIRMQAGLVLEKLGAAGAPAAEALGKAIPAEKVEFIRDQFVAALMAMGPGARPALPALLALLADKTYPERQRIILIGAIPAIDPASRDVLAALTAAGSHEDQAVRSAAATALGKLDPMPVEAVTKLVELARSDRHYNPRLAAVRALALAGPRAKSARAEVEAIATGPQPGLALWGKVGVAAMDGDVARAAPAIRAAMTDRKYPARSASVEALALVGPAKSDVPVLIKLLKDIDSKSREGAARCLSILAGNAAEAAPQLILLLGDRESEVRIAAVEALGEMGPAALPALERIRELTRDPLAAFAAKKTLDKLTRLQKSEEKR